MNAKISAPKSFGSPGIRVRVRVWISTSSNDEIGLISESTNRKIHQFIR